MKREYVAMLATMSTMTGSARCCARSIEKWTAVPGSTQLRLATEKML